MQAFVSVLQCYSEEMAVVTRQENVKAVGVGPEGLVQQYSVQLKGLV